MPAPKPITVTYTPTNQYDGAYDPQPFEIVGPAPQAAITPVELTDVPATFADLAAVRSYLNTLVGELQSSVVFD